MKIRDIVNEYVETSRAQANKTRLDPQVAAKKGAEAQYGPDGSSEQPEITQDFPV